MQVTSGEVENEREISRKEVASEITKQPKR